MVVEKRKETSLLDSVYGRDEVERVKSIFNPKNFLCIYTEYIKYVSPL